MKIVVFANDNLTLTGGNLYDSLLYKTMKQDPTYSIEFCKPIIYKSGFALKKLITPFLELWRLRNFGNKDIFFWNSVDAYHCLLLAFCIRLCYPKKQIFILHHHYKFVEMTGIKKVIFRFFELNFLRTANSIIIPSPYILDQTKEYLPSSSVTYLEIAFKDNHQTATADTIKKGQLLFVGNIEPRKGLHLLVEALLLLKQENIDFCVNILGAVMEPDYYKSLLQKIKEYSLEENILFRGRVSEEEKVFYMKTSDFFVFPSLLEGYGMVIVEAMSYGLPVIAFNNSAMPYTIKDNYNGLLVADKDFHDLKDKLAIILNNAALRKTLSEGAIQTFYKCRKSPQIMEEMSAFVKNLKARS